MSHMSIPTNEIFSDAHYYLYLLHGLFNEHMNYDAEYMKCAIYLTEIKYAIRQQHSAFSMYIVHVLLHACTKCSRKLLLHAVVTHIYFHFQGEFQVISLCLAFFFACLLFCHP